MTKMHLQGLRVMVTRPEPMGKLLCQFIRAADGEAIYFPTLEILPFAVSTQQMAMLDEQDWLIFISPQAVYASSDAIRSHWPSWPSSVQVAAVGSGTASALQERGLPVTVYPSAQWSSEGLLNLPAFLMPTGEKIILICGEDGREHLAESLTSRGAFVSHLIVYRRNIPQVPVENEARLLAEQKVDVIVCTSGEGLHNLKKLLIASWEQLQYVPVVVISQHMVELAKEWGFYETYLAKNASHTAIIETLAQMKRIKHD